ncbi:MAG: hypothetical protein C0600_01635 [Ignavibacteria bacterium]|mgnify:CR=1 FL=1|nr:MAG: hypothetical protein C0600_01635 [Ignavibacteria bacterium]
MSTFETRLSTPASCHITLFHDPTDPCTWVIRKWKKGLFGRRLELSQWFNTKEQAERFANGLIEECEKKLRVHG